MLFQEINQGLKLLQSSIHDWCQTQGFEEAAIFYQDLAIKALIIHFTDIIGSFAPIINKTQGSYFESDRFNKFIFNII